MKINDEWRKFGTGYKFGVRDKQSRAKGGPDVVAFSGGRTSGMMLRMLLDSGCQPVVLFANTGKERDQTLEFVHQIECFYGVDIVWLEYDRVPTTMGRLDALKTKKMKDYFAKQPEMHWFRRVSYETAARHTDAITPFDKLLEWMTVLPNPRVRSCTSQLKIRTMQRYLWSEGIYEFSNFIGFRSDEPDRAYDLIYSADRDKDVRLEFPLCNQGIVEADVMRFWRGQLFDLKLDSYEGNCHLCFLKKRSVKQRLIREQPTLTDWWKKWEDRKAADGNTSGARWRVEKGHSIEELRADAQEEDDGSPAMECACTSAMSLAVGDEMDDAA